MWYAPPLSWASLSGAGENGYRIYPVQVSVKIWMYNTAFILQISKRLHETPSVCVCMKRGQKGCLWLCIEVIKVIICINSCDIALQCLWGRLGTPSGSQGPWVISNPNSRCQFQRGKAEPQGDTRAARVQRESSMMRRLARALGRCLPHNTCASMWSPTARYLSLPALVEATWWAWEGGRSSVL